MPKQTIESDLSTAPGMQHLVAAQAIGRELLAAFNEQRAIGNDIEPINGHDGEIIDLLSLPPPLE